MEVLIQSEGTPTYLDDTYVIDGTFTFDAGILGDAALASSIAGAKYPQPMRISTGVTFSGLANVPGAMSPPADSEAGWTAFDVGRTLPFSTADWTPYTGLQTGIITVYFHRYDIQTSGGAHLGYLYKQAYYNASMQEVGYNPPNSPEIPVWIYWRPIPGNAESGGGTFVGPRNAVGTHVFNIGHVQPGALDPAAPQVAPAVHRFSLGYKASNAAERG